MVDALNRFSAEELKIYGPMAVFGGTEWQKLGWPVDGEGEGDGKGKGGGYGC